jgi:hypothetical protein
MAVQWIISRTFELRAFLVFATLISLCVSNNVGPSFLPLPVVTDRLVENSHGERDTTSRLPNPTESDSFRVPMMGQTQKRAAKEPQPQPVATTLKVGFVLPTEARVAAELGFPIPLFTSASVSPPPGRAPPRLV